MNNTTTATAVQAAVHLIDRHESETFLTRLAEGETDHYFWGIDDTRPARFAPVSMWANLDDEQTWNTLDLWQKHGAGVFVAVNEFTLHSLTRAKEALLRIRTVYADQDHGTNHKYPLDPSLIVESSPGKQHVYWFVADEMSIEQCEGVQNRLLSYGGDRNAKDSARVLRLPGTLNLKDPANPQRVRIIHDDGAQPFTTAQLLESFPPVYFNTLRGLQDGDLQEQPLTVEEIALAELIVTNCAKKTVEDPTLGRHGEILKAGTALGRCVPWPGATGARGWLDLFAEHMRHTDTAGKRCGMSPGELATLTDGFRSGKNEVLHMWDDVQDCGKAPPIENMKAWAFGLADAANDGAESPDKLTRLHRQIEFLKSVPDDNKYIALGATLTMLARSDLESHELEPLLADIASLKLKSAESVEAVRKFYNKEKAKWQKKQMAFGAAEVANDTETKEPKSARVYASSDLVTDGELAPFFPANRYGTVQEILKTLNRRSNPDGVVTVTKHAGTLQRILRGGCGTIYPTFYYNEFSQRLEMESPTGGARTIFKEHVYSHLQAVISDDFDTDFAKSAIIDQTIVIAHSNKYHPVRDYLTGLRWDGTPRLDNWMTHILGVEDSAYARAVGGTLLCGMVQRVMKPGSQYDYVVILEGTQGKAKTSFVNALPPNPDWFITQPIKLDNTQTDSLIAAAGSWVWEIGELKGFTHKDLEAVKQFITKRVDIYREPYARGADRNPRQFVFVGTTNQTQYLEDVTGNRRSLPVRCTKVDLETFVANRDQLFAEAFAKVQTVGFNAFTLYPDIEQLAVVEQEKRRVADPWEEIVNELTQGRNSVLSSEIAHALGFVNKKDHTKAVWQKIGRVMEALKGWEGPKSVRSDSQDITFKDKSAKGYARAVPVQPPLTLVVDNTANGLYDYRPPSRP
ncbi:VapE domain-containing protein [uncultured Thiodictyon sp.]|uniref:VapE domain-containing protein n=1 Tax=uncultured Thiodictyon sp. TaxID=1846217 RepID=UPI0025DE5CB6|nr:VapE domain-containing protein [uncultured Thiodictyon sp.]